MPTTRSPLESKIERDFVAYVISKGEQCLKLASPGTRGLPDRFVPFGKVGGNELTWFIEFKREGEALRPEQAYWAKKLTEKGYAVDVFDSLEEAKQTFDAWHAKIQTLRKKFGAG